VREKKKRIIIIDDHPLFREGLKSIISQDSQYEVVAETGDGHGSLQKIRELKPDLAVVDISLPDQSGIELTHKIIKYSPQTLVLIVSMHSKVDYIVKSFQAGAMGYIVKESAGDMLMTGISQVFQGNYFMDASVSQQVIKKLVRMSTKEPVSADFGYDALTYREQEVIILLAEGLTIKDVADRLFISPKTAENHRNNIMRKLDLHNTVELIRYAAKVGLIDIDLWKE